MPDDTLRCSTSSPTFYPLYMFDHSPTYNTWVHLTAADVHTKLKQREGFEGQDIWFWDNHPIRWVRIVGVVIAYDDFDKKVVITVDDGSGHLIELISYKTPSPDPNATAPVNLDGVGLHSVIKAKGTINEFWERKEMKLRRVAALRDTNAEVIAWMQMTRLKKDILFKPWVVPEDLLRREKRKKEREQEKKQRLEEQGNEQELPLWGAEKAEMKLERSKQTKEWIGRRRYKNDEAEGREAKVKLEYSGQEGEKQGGREEEMEEVVSSKRIKVEATNDDIKEEHISRGYSVGITSSFRGHRRPEKLKRETGLLTEDIEFKTKALSISPAPRPSLPNVPQEPEPEPESEPVSEPSQSLKSKYPENSTYRGRRRPANFKPPPRS